MEATAWFDSHGWILKEIPEEAVSDCSAGGQDASPMVEHWINELGFSVPRQLAINYLREYGAWDDLKMATDETLAERVFWLACGDIAEQGEYFGLVH